MSFSLDSFIFVLITFLIFYFIRRRARAYFLLIISLGYIYLIDSGSLIWLLSVTILVYFSGLIIELLKTNNKKKLSLVFTVFSIALCVASLFVLKHVARWNFTDKILGTIIMPVGFSYYIFQAISYIADIYSGKISAEKNVLFFSLYMCFFPKFISGPIEKPSNLISQIKSLHNVYIFEDNKLSVAFASILYGYFIKTVIADRIALYTSKILDTPQAYGSLWLFAGMLLYTLQIYCDFAGYSSIAVGVAKLFGINLTQNFFAPYLSSDIGTFWRRWHISLSGWLKEYIYIPLGGNRKGTMRKYLNLFLVFVICGLWHGAGLNFLIWGVLHGIFSIVNNYLSDKKFAKKFAADHRKTSTVVSTIITVLLVAFAWIFFGSSSSSSAFLYIKRMLSFTAGDTPLPEQSLLLGVTSMDFIIIPVYAIIIFCFDILMVRTDLPFGEALQKIPYQKRYLIEFLMVIGIFILGIYGSGYNPDNFIYMSF